MKKNSSIQLFDNSIKRDQNLDFIKQERLREKSLCPLSTIQKKFTSNSTYDITRQSMITQQNELLPHYHESSDKIGRVNENLSKWNQQINQKSNILKRRKATLQIIHPLIKQQVKSLTLQSENIEQKIYEQLFFFCKTVSNILFKNSDQLQKYKLEIQKKNGEIQKFRKQQQKLLQNVKKANQFKNSGYVKKLQQENYALLFKYHKLQSGYESILTNMKINQDNKNKDQRCSLLAKEKFSDNQEITFTMLSHEIKVLKQENQNYTYIINNLRIELIRLQDELHQSQQTLKNQEIMKKQLKILKSQRQRLYRYRQLYCMCREQKEQIQFNMKIDAERLRRYQIIIRKLRQKILNYASLIGKGNVNIIIDNQEKQLIQKIKATLMNNDGFKKICQKQFKVMQRFQNQINIPSFVSSNKSSMQKSKIYYPSFFYLLEQDIKQFELDIKASFTKPMISKIFLKIRAIMDSKFNQYSIYDQESLSTRFPDFVYSFLEKFEIQKNFKKIIQNEQIKSQNYRSKKTFLLELFNPKIQKLCEMVTFRQFLLDNCPEDQIYYYLHCRNLIFQGPQLQNYINTSDFIVLIRFQETSRYINYLLKRYNRDVQTTVNYNLNLKKKKKNNQYYIDSGYVLRVLLQVYRMYKKFKFEKIKLVLLKLQEILNINQIKFGHFKQIIQLNFPKISLCKISAMYRQVINIFKGSNDFIGAFYAVTSQRLFIHYTKELFRESQKINLKKHLNPFTILNPNILASFGVEQLMIEYNNLIKNTTDTVSTQIKKNIFLQKILILIDIRLQYDPQKNKVGCIKAYIQNHIQKNNESINILNLLQVQKEKKIENSGNLLTRVFRKRIKLFYQLFIGELNKKIQKYNASITNASK